MASSEKEMITEKKKKLEEVQTLRLDVAIQAQLFITALVYVKKILAEFATRETARQK